MEMRKCKEAWKIIEEYGGLYEVSDSGKVRSKNGILKQTKAGNNYFYVRLSKNGIEKKHYVHRLVAKAFIKNNKSFRCVNHKDENKDNNAVENLEWCDHKYNNNYGSKPEKISEKKSIPIIATVIRTGEIEEYNSITDATKTLSGRENCCSNISAVIKGNRKSAYGRKWERK